MSRESRGDRDRGDGAGGLDDKVSTFGGDLSDLSDAELERRAEAYLGFEGTWNKSGVSRGGD